MVMLFSNGWTDVTWRRLRRAGRSLPVEQPFASLNALAFCSMSTTVEPISDLFEARCELVQPDSGVVKDRLEALACAPGPVREHVDDDQYRRQKLTCNGLRRTDVEPIKAKLEVMPHEAQKSEEQNYRPPGVNDAPDMLILPQFQDELRHAIVVFSLGSAVYFTAGGWSVLLCFGSHARCLRKKRRPPDPRSHATEIGGHSHLVPTEANGAGMSAQACGRDGGANGERSGASDRPGESAGERERCCVALFPARTCGWVIRRPRALYSLTNFLPALKGLGPFAAGKLGPLFPSGITVT